jgi:antitoxin ParD1/3/4
MSADAVMIRDVVLSPDAADLVRRKLASGQFATESEVIVEGLRSLADREAEIERWLHDEVAATFDAVAADPSGETVSAHDVFAGLRRRHAERLSKAGA